ncbi:hypothetical protein G5B35_06850 [Parapusillimonas sp. SGNA-6]|nr:hypothetical protein [Parapusillimonas sp. SGNA-6]
MIFMSQSGLLDRTREAEWDAWYVDHLRIMETVDGIHSARRFKSESAGHSPSLAMYSVASIAVFDDPYYQKIRGMGEWLPLIDQNYYRRNLFEGLDVAPEVPEGHALWVADRQAPDLVLKDIGFSWLKSVALDRSTPYRGIAVVPPGMDESLARDAGVGIYKPFIL